MGHETQSLNSDRSPMTPTYLVLRPPKKGDLSHCLSKHLPHSPPCHGLPKGVSECRALSTSNSANIYWTPAPCLVLHCTRTAPEWMGHSSSWQGGYDRGVYFSSLYNSHLLRNALQTGVRPASLEPQIKPVVTSSSFHLPRSLLLYSLDFMKSIFFSNTH